MPNFGTAGTRSPHGHEKRFPGLADRGDDPVAARRLTAEGGPGPVPAELAQELGGGERALVAGERSPEGVHQRRRPGARDAEEPFEIAAGEEVAVELPRAVGWRRGWRGATGAWRARRYAAIPRWALRMGGWTAGIFYGMLVDGRPRRKLRAGRVEDPIKRVMG